MSVVSSAEHRMPTVEQYGLGGWALFVLCSVCSFISAARAGDGWAVSSAVLFFLACFLFLLPPLLDGRRTVDVASAEPQTLFAEQQRTAVPTSA